MKESEWRSGVRREPGVARHESGRLCWNVLVLTVISHHGGDLGPAKRPGGLETTMTSNQLVPTADPTDHYRLQQTVLAQAVGELGERREIHARVAAAETDGVDW